MTLRERMNEDLKLAMKARNARRVSALRLVFAAIKDREIRAENPQSAVTDAEIVALLAKMIKQREESASIYEFAGRPELASAEREESSIIREFMPRQFSELEMHDVIRQTIADTGASGPKDMGKVMAALKQRHTGSIDFSRAGALVKELLATPAT